NIRSNDSSCGANGKHKKIRPRCHCFSDGLGLPELESALIILFVTDPITNKKFEIDFQTKPKKGDPKCFYAIYS
ncbi:MAG: hypothetical protein KDC71_23230, partial [Acidobacteria bacterium]|nr:hypothetical protein [Acidobacteriota bacterium]